MIKWSDIHVGVGAFGTIYLGKSRPSKEYDGLTVWTDRSGDMTDECLVAVRDHLEARIQKGKNTTGYVWKRKDGKTAELRLTMIDASEED